MGKKYKVGIIGYAHSHIYGNAMSFHNLGDRIQWIAAADVKPLVEPLDNGEGTRYGIMNDLNKKLGITNIYDDYIKMLDENSFDIILVCAENAFHARVCQEILARGIHVVMEKPLVTSMQEASSLARVLKGNKAELILNWPTTWSPYVRKAYELCESGEIGKLFKFTFRNGDSEGPLSYGQKLEDHQKGAEWWYQKEAGGGAFLDYCCYGACLSRWFFGENAIAAYGMGANFNSPYGNVEDYATITVRYPKGVAILEGSWTTRNTGIPNGPILYGLEGTIVVDNDEVRVYKTRHKLEPDAVYSNEKLPEGRATLGEEVLYHLDTGEPLHPTLEFNFNFNAMQVLDAGMRSAASHKLELTQDNVWTIG
jgi:predicted dehydrogenase